MSGTDPVSGFSEAERLRAEIELTRSELGETVEALAAKADVKARAKETVEDVKARARESVADATARAKDSVAAATARAKETVGGATVRAKETVGGATAKARDSVAAGSEKLHGTGGGMHRLGTGPEPEGQELTLSTRPRAATWLPVALTAVVGGLVGWVVAALRRRRS